MKRSKFFVLIVAAMTAIVSGCSTIRSQIISHDSKTTSVVVIGMERSKAYGSCPGAQFDSDRMYQFFKAKYSNVALLQNNKATKKAVLAALANAAKADFMIVFYSGHGGSDPFGDTDMKDEPDGKDEYLCLYDTYLRDNEIWSIIKSKKGRVWMIFDCCHSETMFRATGMNMKMVGSLPFSASSSLNMLCWSGCADNTYSYGDAGGGQFTNALFANYKNGITYNEWWNKMRRDETLCKYQLIKQTKMGFGFDDVKALE